MPNMIAKARLFLTADSKALVREGDERGATLYCAPGDEIPESAAEMFGLKDGDLPSKGGKGGKEAGAGSNKEKDAGDNKGGAGAADATKGAGAAAGDGGAEAGAKGQGAN